MSRALKTIEPEELEALLKEKDGNIVLVDIRDRMAVQNAFEGQASAVHIPLKLLPTRYETLEPFREKTLVLVSASERQAAKAQKVLEKAGVWDLRGMIVT